MDTPENISPNDLAHYPDADASLNPQEALKLFLDNKWPILSLTALFSLLSVIYFSSLPNIYTASSQVLVEKVGEQQQKVFQNIQAPGSNVESDDMIYDYYGTQIAVLKSSKITDMVTQEAGGVSGFSFQARRLSKTGVIQITISHRDPEIAAKVANKYADIFVRESQNEQSYVNDQLLKYFPDSDDLLKDGGLRKIGGNIDKKQFADSLLQIATDPEINQMKTDRQQARMKLKELQQRYKPEHPEVKEAAERVADIDKSIKERTDNLIEIMKQGLSGQVKVSNVRVLEYARVPAEPSQPNRPRGILLATIMGFFASVGIVFAIRRFHSKVVSQKDLQSLGLTFLGYVPTIRQLSKTRKKDVLASNVKISLIDLIEKEPVLADAVVNVRTHLLFSIPYEKSKRIMVTSAVPNEGKTTVAVLLAISMAALGRKILLIDGDLRRPSVDKYLGLEEKPGLSDYLLGVCAREEVIYQVPNHTLSVVPAGQTQIPHAPEILSTDRFRDLVDFGTENYDRVIVDVPPSLRIPDALIVAKYFHASVLVCGSNMVYKKTIQMIKEKFDAVHQTLIGVVINQADYETEDYYHKGYQGYYQYGYGAQKRDGKSRLSRWKFADKG